MILYRISNCRHAEEVTGVGASLYGGRWNSTGVALLYMAENRALAALEVLANRNKISKANNLCLTQFKIPEISTLDLDLGQLPKDWKNYPSSLTLKKLGDNFIKQGEFLLLKVPSVLIEDEFNFLMNPEHTLATSIEVVDVKPFNFDSRLS